jgi:hypothetical protein
LVFKFKNANYAYTGAKNIAITPRNLGEVWVVGDVLAYTDAAGVARIITGVTENVVSGQPAGAIYVKGVQLRWVSAISPYYEYILI